MSVLNVEHVRESLRKLRAKLTLDGKPLCVCIAEGNEDVIWNTKGLTVLKDLSGVDELLNLMEGIVSISNVVIFITPAYWNVAITEADVAIIPLAHSVKIAKWRGSNDFSGLTLPIDYFVKELTDYNND